MNKPDLKLVEGGGGGARAAPHREPSPEQAEMPFALVDGEVVTQLPHDLYIPPDALQVVTADMSMVPDVPSLESVTR